ncbi:MAG TPA: DUF4012 domain-containing protein, partial [Ktedonobacteraceae bacterium]|nr:DUF4012 domain-containing protein [Ktedonobacteraceae bacterium]
GIAGIVPVFGPRLEAAIHLSSLAVNVSQAGVDGCKLLSILLPHFHNPLASKSPALTEADFKLITSDAQTIVSALSGAMDEAMQLQPGDVAFDARLPGLLTGFQAKIPMLRPLLADANQLLPSLPALLGVGSPVNYLVEILDATEIRPAGGFIGNYGILTIEGGHPLPLHITDVDLLDIPFKHTGRSIGYPPADSWFSRYLSHYSWSLHDSNLEADFPTAARAGEYTYQREGGAIPLQGVIAITPVLIEQVFAITGPIYVPEYKETITAQNLISRIHFHQLGPAGEGPDYLPSPDGHSSERKRFTELLGEHLLARLQQLPSDTTAKFLQLLVTSIQDKVVQAYFNDQSAEHVLQTLHLDGAIQSPPGDHLVVVDANVSPNKANSFIVDTVHDQVTIDEHGNATHVTTITYAWTLAGQNYGSSIYRDYARVFVPSNASLTSQNGWQPYGTSTAYGDQVWSGYFTLTYGQTHTITLQWSSDGAATRNAQGWHYQYLLQRQAGIQRTLDLQVMLPSCATATSGAGGFVSGGHHIATLAEAWNEDVNASLTYTC